jgi:hypothetical protein
MTRSTLNRIVRYCQRTGTIQPGDSPVLVAATVRGFLRGLAARRYYRNGGTAGLWK